jgi:hypothetical protein
MATRAKHGAALWRRVWRSSGIGAVVFFGIAAVVRGGGRHLGAAVDELVSLYCGDRLRIVFAGVITGHALLNVLSFAVPDRQPRGEREAGSE